MYLALASIFVAQVAELRLTWSEQLAMVFMLMITSKGVAGVRARCWWCSGHGGHLSPAQRADLMLLGIDAVMDMGRTGVNVIGNCLACAVVARSEGELAPAVSASE